MRILLAHNRYQHRGGEDLVFEAEGQLLRDHGHEVLEFIKTNDAIGNKGSFKVAIGAIWAQNSYRELRQQLRDLRPDIIHIHNYFPIISPAVFYAGDAEGVPVVQTVHNYRYLCLNGMLIRDERICEDCVSKRLKWPGIVHRCYRDNLLASATVASMLSIHDLIGTWRTKATRFIVLTDFQREKLAVAGIPPEKVVIKPNFCPDPGAREKADRSANGGLFIGRLSFEKGIDVLVNAASKCDVPIELVGSGPKLDAVAAAAPPNLHVHGYVDDAVLGQIKRDALFLVLPSIVYEGFPMVIAEAFAMGIPIIASRHGGMREIVEEGRTGLHFTPGDPDDLCAKVRWAAENPDKMAIMGENARKVYEERFSPEQNYRRLIEIYRGAIEAVSRAKKRPAV